MWLPLQYIYITLFSYTISFGTAYFMLILLWVNPPSYEVHRNSNISPISVLVKFSTSLLPSLQSSNSLMIESLHFSSSGMGKYFIVFLTKFLLRILINPICQHFELIENRTAEDFDIFSYLICFSVGQLLVSVYTC